MKEIKVNKDIDIVAIKAYQEKIDGAYLTVYEYDAFKQFGKSWESRMQFEVDDDITMNIILFSYKEKDFKKMISDAKKIIKKLK